MDILYLITLGIIIVHSEFRQAQLIRRPLRIAVIVNPENPNILDQIENFYIFSMKCWGGRFYAIIPLIKSELTNACGCLLKACDPDYIISYEELSLSLIQKIKKIISPIDIHILKQNQYISNVIAPETCLKIPSEISKLFSL